MSTLVRRATPADVDDMVVSLTEGFADDPLWTWIYKTDELYHRLAPSYFRWTTERTLATGEAYIAEGKGALLMRHSSTVNVDDEHRGEIEKQLHDVGGECAENLLTCMNLVSDKHPMERPHWYSALGAVRKQFRSQAIGIALLRCVFRDLPVYGEATTARNVELYKKFGFQALETFFVAENITLTQIWREPSTP